MTVYEYWLPVRQWIIYKLAVLSFFKIHRTATPAVRLITARVSARTLHSALCDIDFL